MSIVDEARAWLAEDPDPETRRELEDLLARQDVAALEERFSGTLRFGTAGLRGLLGAGPKRMNRVTVARATAGLCAWLKQQVPDAEARGLCVGRDARPKSDLFEREVIEVATGAGFKVHSFSGLVPTPLLAYSVLEVGAAGGVMITASHNPPGYNGYKVYWENGAQIIPPNDQGIAAEIESAPAFSRLPRLSIDAAREQGLLDLLDAQRERYVATISSAMKADERSEPLRIAYTALHGVAEDTFRRVVTSAGYADVHSVAEQAEPDGEFPTVAFPNPEEPGAMNRVLSLAEEVNADLVIANDPDGDRVGAAARGEAGFETLSGNDLGILLADELLSRYRENAQPLVLSTIVSSPLLGSVAASHGARWEQTLTGHKWIQNRAIELEDEGLVYVFGYEEALGYAPCKAVRDKDGISSALLLIDMSARLKSQGETLLDARDRLWRKHGYYADAQVSTRFEGPDAEARMKDAVDRLRESPPREIGGALVVRGLDPERRIQWTPATQGPFTELAPSNVLIFELQGGHRAMVRPSGTEPKLKYYFYAKAAPGTREDPQAAKESARTTLALLVEDLTRPSDC